MARSRRGGRGRGYGYGYGGAERDTPALRPFRADLDIHTPFSANFQHLDATYLQILQTAEARGLDIIALTDHNSVGGIAAMRREIEDLALLEELGRLAEDEASILAEYRRLLDRVLVLPGFELTAAYGFHLLGIFPPETSVRRLEHVLLLLGVTEEQMDGGTAQVTETADVLAAYEIIDEYGGLVIPAHANAAHGVGQSGRYGEQTRVAYTQSPLIAALDVTDLDDASRRGSAALYNGSRPDYPRRMHLIQTSDAHRLTREGAYRDGDLGIGDRAMEFLLPDRGFAALRTLFFGDDYARAQPYAATPPASANPILAARDAGATMTQAFHEQARSRRSRYRPLLKDIVAFANTNGGTIYVGMGANPATPITGVPLVEETVRGLRDSVTRSIIPPLDVEMRVEEIAGKAIIVIGVPKGPNTPYATDAGQVFVRQDAETVIALRDEIVQLVQEAKGDRIWSAPRLAYDPEDEDAEPDTEPEPPPPAPIPPPLPLPPARVTPPVATSTARVVTPAPPPVPAPRPAVPAAPRSPIGVPVAVATQTATTAAPAAIAVPARVPAPPSLPPPSSPAPPSPTAPSPVLPVAVSAPAPAIIAPALPPAPPVASPVVPPSAAPAPVVPDAPDPEPELAAHMATEEEALTDEDDATAEDAHGEREARRRPPRRRAGRSRRGGTDPEETDDPAVLTTNAETAPVAADESGELPVAAVGDVTAADVNTGTPAPNRVPTRVYSLEPLPAPATDAAPDATPVAASPNTLPSLVIEATGKEMEPPPANAADGSLDATDATAAPPRRRRRRSSAQSKVEAQATDIATGATSTASEPTTLAPTMSGDAKAKTESATATLAADPTDAPVLPQRDVVVTTTTGGSDTASAPEMDTADVAPPASGVEILAVTEAADGTRRYALRDLRTGRELTDVTRKGARGQWRYAVLAREDRLPNEDRIVWQGARGYGRTMQRDGKAEHDLALRTPTGTIRFFYAVTDDGLDAAWRAVLPRP